MTHMVALDVVTLALPHDTLPLRARAPTLTPSARRYGCGARMCVCVCMHTCWPCSVSSFSFFSFADILLGVGGPCLLVGRGRRWVYEGELYLL